MNTSPESWSCLQQWLQEAIVRPEQARHEEVEAVILPSRGLSAGERLAVYQHAYVARLLGCLREMFPALAFTLGQHGFAALGREYLASYPPTSYTLDQLGRHLEAFLSHLREQHGETAAPWAETLVELARLEHTIANVFDGPGLERTAGLDLGPLAAAQPERLGQVQLRLAPCMQLLRFHYRVNDYYSACRKSAFKGSLPPFPERAATFLAITRRNYVVRRVPLSGVQYTLLEALGEGAPLAAALQRAAEAIEDRAALANLPAALHGWFARWAEENFFAAVESPGS